MSVSARTSASRARPVEAVVADLLAPLEGATPRAAFVNCTAGLDVDRLVAALGRALPETAWMGTTVCQQVATDAGAGATAGALFLLGDGFRAGVAVRDAAMTPDLGRTLATRALDDAGMAPGDVRFAVLHATPGIEAEVLAGLGQVLPASVPIVGGSAADDDIGGAWRVFARGQVAREGASLMVCDWPGPVGVTYQSGYMATGIRGTVTRADGRTIHEIDGEPAAAVYERWLGQSLPRGESVLGVTTLSPLGVVRGYAAGMDLHVLVHPEVLTAQGAIQTFAEVSRGETVELMRSTAIGLVGRGVSVTRFARTRARIEPEDMVAQLVVYCAGCSLALGDEVEDMVRRTAQAHGVPLLMPFTFGEQGVLTLGRAEHGNLMCVPLVLGRF